MLRNVEIFKLTNILGIHEIQIVRVHKQCYFQLSPGGEFPPESQIPPRKTPKIQKTLKNVSNLPPRYVFPPPEPGV